VSGSSGGNTTGTDDISGHVTHGTDRPLWSYRLSVLNDDQRETARSWLDAVSAALKGDQSDDITVHKRGLKYPILVLTEDRKIEWQEDGLWERLMRLETAFKL
jgi:hypothetical protein